MAACASSALLPARSAVFSEVAAGGVHRCAGCAGPGLFQVVSRCFRRSRCCSSRSCPLTLRPLCLLASPRARPTRLHSFVRFCLPVPFPDHIMCGLQVSFHSLPVKPSVSACHPASNTTTTRSQASGTGHTYRPLTPERSLSCYFFSASSLVSRVGPVSASRVLSAGPSPFCVSTWRSLSFSRVNTPSCLLSSVDRSYWCQNGPIHLLLGRRRPYPSLPHRRPLRPGPTSRWSLSSLTPSASGRPPTILRSPNPSHITGDDFYTRQHSRGDKTCKHAVPDHGRQHLRGRP